MDYKRKRAARLGDEGMKECAPVEEEHTLIERPPGVGANICRKMRISPGASDDVARSEEGGSGRGRRGRRGRGGGVESKISTQLFIFLLALRR